MKHKWFKKGILIAGILACATFTGCSSCSRVVKSVKSDAVGGLSRTVTVYDYNGQPIDSWTGKFDVSHFVSLHKFLFEDIYPFAGLFRTENIAKDYFNNVKHQTVEIIKLNGSVELGPLVELSDVIVDIVETGSTLRENGLEVLEEVCPLSARMIVNPVSMQMEADRIRKLVGAIREQLKIQS